jgi:hypothetical protein
MRLNNSWGALTMVSTRMRIAAAVAASIAGTAVAVPAHADAQTATNQLNLLGGSLSIGSLAATTLPSAALSAGTVSGAVDSGNWSDTTGSGAGWNGTVSTTQFVLQGPWQAGGGGSALTNTGSGAYSGSAGAALVVVTVSAGGTATNTPFTWTDNEGSSQTSGTVSTCTNATACAVSNGVTITFNAATTYTSGWTYTAHVGAQSASAMSLTTASATGPTAVGSTAGGSNLPTFLNNGSTVTASAVKFVHATAGTGMGTFTLAAGVTVTWDPNNTWSSSVAGANYTATATYTISSGP